MAKQKTQKGKPVLSREQRKMRVYQIIMAVVGVIMILSMIIAAVAK
jgi:predicted nucleic acid-binding Zn ribbon protein